jgi:plastocyanin domain-containing protein
VKEILTTIDLKMFEITRKPKKNKRKKKKDKLKEDFGGISEVGGVDDERVVMKKEVVAESLDQAIGKQCFRK